MTQHTPQDKVYFPNLNGLRAIGAFTVLFSHFCFLKIMWGFQARQWFPIPGKVGVALFFALSGFLITSLLFRELDKTSTIRLKDFYIRRILRIWPLYYLIVLLGLLVFNRIPVLKIPVLSDRMIQDMNWVNLLNVLLIIPNFTHFYIPYTDQRWSIIVEELFYFIQPMLVRTFRNKYVLICCFCAIVFSSEGFAGLIRLFHLDRHVSPNVTGAILGQLGYLGCIAVGCIFSALYKKRETFCKKYLFSRWTQIAIVVLLLVCFYISYVQKNELYFDLRWYSFLFAIVVLNAALNPATIYRLEHPVLNYLGKISYGIYMYHMFCLGIAFVIARALTSNPWIQNPIYFVLSIGLTIGVSALSFKYLEAFFLGLKKHPIARSQPQSGIAYRAK